MREAEFHVVKVLTPEEITEFKRRWEEKTEVKVPLQSEGGVQFKLDIAQENRGGRWLYYTSGLITLLDHRAHAVYRMSDPAAFNQLIGVMQ